MFSRKLWTVIIFSLVAITSVAQDDAILVTYANPYKDITCNQTQMDYITNELVNNIEDALDIGMDSEDITHISDFEYNSNVYTFYGNLTMIAHYLRGMMALEKYQCGNVYAGLNSLYNYYANSARFYGYLALMYETDYLVYIDEDLQDDVRESIVTDYLDSRLILELVLEMYLSKGA